MKQRVEYRKSYLWFGPLVLLALASCGEHIGTLQSISADKQEATSTRTLSADLKSLNATLMPSEGEAKMVVGGDSLEVEIDMRNVSESSHRQTLIRGACPGSSADTNGDGIIDGTEYELGDSVVWELDDSLEDTAGESVYPVGDASGQYQYSESLAQMAETMALPDFKTGEYSIVVFGADEEMELPETVSGEASAIPMACGILEEEVTSEEPQDDGDDMPQDMGQDQGQQQQQQQQQQHQQGQQTQQSQQGQHQQNVMIPEVDESDMESIVIE